MHDPDEKLINLKQQDDLARATIAKLTVEAAKLVERHRYSWIIPASAVIVGFAMGVLGAIHVISR